MKEEGAQAQLARLLRSLAKLRKVSHSVSHMTLVECQPTASFYIA